MKHRRILTLLVVLSLLPIACGAAETVSNVVERFAGLIDEAGCEIDCERENCTFSRYEYHGHHCWCECGEAEEQLY